MRKIGYSVCSVFQLILSAVLFIIWYIVFSNVPDFVPMYYWENILLIVHFVTFVIMEYFIKVNVLFKRDYSFRYILFFIGAYNLICLLVIMAFGVYDSPIRKIGLISLVLTMTIPDLILSIKLLKDIAKEKRLREKN
jgi:hypothetical protein